jgi:hypothetical protein
VPPDRPGVTSSSGGEFLDLADWVDLSRRPTQWRLAMARKTITLEIEAESEGLLSSTDADPEKGRGNLGSSDTRLGEAT